MKNKGIISLDLVILATPSGLHASQVLKQQEWVIFVRKTYAPTWKKGN